MEKFEYKYLYRIKNAAELDTQLNDDGNNGWEAISIVWYDDGWWAWLKRRKETV